MNLNDKLKIARTHLGKSQKEMAEMVGAGHRSWQGYEQGTNTPGGKVFEALLGLGFNISWFYSDNVPMLLEESNKSAGSTGQPMAAPTKTAAQGQDITDSVNIQELINMTAEVLVSDTVYRPALAANIKAFHRSIALEHDNQEFRSRIERMEQRMEIERTSFEQRMTAMEERLTQSTAAPPPKAANG